MSTVPVIPDSAPFTPAQRGWLNGFLAGLFAGAPGAFAGAAATETASAPAAEDPHAITDDDLPWHDPALAIEERSKLAEGRPLAHRLMAAMGQLDCGQCGYDCRRYAEALAARAEADASKCVPGGKPTQKVVKLMLAEGPASGTAATGANGAANAANGATAKSAMAAGTTSIAGASPTLAAKSVPPDAQPGYHRDLPLLATLVSSEPLTAAASEKRVHHVVLDLAMSGLEYTPGDALGVWAQNNPEEVEILLGLVGARGSEPVQLGDGAIVTAREALTRECDLRVPTSALYWTMSRFARSTREADLLKRLAEDDADADRFGIHEVLNVLSRFPSARPPVHELVAALGKLQPRLYSIASSLRAHPREVHLTIGVVGYERFHRDYWGVASSFFADRCRPGKRVPVYVQRSHGFRLPADPMTPVIMIGPGTGIAPFRAFLEERAAAATPGRNWLFFGNPHRETDYLYERELEGFLARGALTRLDTAFSRDQAEKVYVQHRIRERAADLWQWLQEGAHVYVCGDAKRMAKDVDDALREVIAREGGMEPDAAKAYLASLAKSGRYARDVY